MNPALEALLQPIAGATPTGSDGYTAISELEDQCKPTVTSVVESGKMVDTVQDANWTQLRQRAAKILEKESKHLRAAMVISVAAAKSGSLQELVDTLELSEKLLDTFWDGLHPMPDPDDNDPYQRINILNDLSHPVNTENDHYNFVLKVTRIPIAENPQVGRISLLDHEVARGAMSDALLGDRPPMTPDQVSAVFRAAETEKLKATAELLENAVNTLNRISDIFRNKRGEDSVPNFTLLKATLERAREAISPYIDGGAPASGADGAEATAGGPGSTMAGAGGLVIQGAIRSRSDALTALDAVIRYYEQVEPSSPIPLLLQRAKALATMNFFEIVNNLTPEALERLKIIVGDQAGGSTYTPPAENN